MKFGKRSGNDSLYLADDRQKPRTGKQKKTMKQSQRWLLLLLVAVEVGTSKVREGMEDFLI